MVVGFNESRATQTSGCLIAPLGIPRKSRGYNYTHPAPDPWRKISLNSGHIPGIVKQVGGRAVNSIAIKSFNLFRFSCERRVSAEAKKRLLTSITRAWQRRQCSIKRTLGSAYIFVGPYRHRPAPDVPRWTLIDAISENRLYTTAFILSAVSVSLKRYI